MNSCHLMSLFCPTGLRYALPTLSTLIDVKSIFCSHAMVCCCAGCAGRFNAKSFDNFHDGLYWNDGLHWLESAKGDFNYKLDVEDPHLRSRRIPRTAHAGDYYQKLFVSRGCLLLLGTENTYSLQMNIYEMRKWSLGWSLKYFVNLNDISRQFPKPSWDPKWSCSSVGCIVIKENENDSFHYKKNGF
ncbi:hypothetical protein QVD17_20687 [Tagetes erecta]|uniref:Uncharacterized protein n=1 Tax=Tagetes erecta TaxID=13708 RepID=A0AAD8KQD6_TARER|nr:hypothetical protein QVD17_20687 [Tagetes erecta]